MYNNGMCGNNCLWIIILLILFCGCGSNGFCGNTYGGGNNGCGCNCGCERENNCCC